MSMAPAFSIPAGFRVQTSEGICRVTLTRPEKRNALTHDLLTRLESVLYRATDDPRCRVVVIAAEGTAFCAGHDLSEMLGREEEDYEAIFVSCTRFMKRLREMPQPVIARVQGPALAAGTQLVASCDLAVAAESATFSTPGVKIGLFCTTPMVPLVRAIPAKAALEMLVTGAPISAHKALELGLVNRVVPEDRLDAAIKELTDAIEAASPLAIRIGKEAFYDHISLPENKAYDKATVVMAQNAMLADAQEGIRAFLEKRKPVWKGI
jgi:enoyl-CoA hydratase/carnithine racemase